MNNTSRYIGQKFHRYTILEYIGMKNKSQMVLAECQCGTKKIVHLDALKCGSTKSCGCYKRDFMGTYAIKHNLWKHPLFHIWSSMKGRCSNPSYDAYPRYGGRGIGVFKGWVSDFKSFYDWSISNGWKEGLQLDRRNNNKGYSPSNCRFVTPSINCRNKSNNRLITYKGKTKTLTEWASELKIPYTRIWARLANNPNMPIEVVFSHPSNPGNNFSKYR